MRETILRIRTYNTFEKKFISNPEVKYDSPCVCYTECLPFSIITHYSGVNDTKGKMIWEGDIIRLTKDNEEPFIGVVTMERRDLNDKIFSLRPAWKIIKSDTMSASDTEYFILIDTPTTGEKRIHGHFIHNNYPINKENGTGFSDGTVSEVLGNVFENQNLLPHCEFIQFAVKPLSL